jgi:glycogen debranching enzyme
LSRRLQPLLHDLVPTVAAPTSALSGPDGQIRATGVQGVFHADLRALSQAVLRLDGREPEPIMHVPAGPGTARFVSLARWLGDPGPDPTVRIDRVRQTEPDGLAEEIEIVSTSAMPVRTRVTLDLACDAAPIDVVKRGAGWTHEPPVQVGPAGLAWAPDAAEITATGDGAEVHPGGLSWDVELPPRGRTMLRWRLRVRDRGGVVVAPRRRLPEWSRPEVSADDRRLVRLLDRSLDDLASLRLSERGEPDDVFIAGGVPWFLTLFGRDSIWAARMLLPLGTELAAGTLRVLARRQGRWLDADTGEAPGKIMHELRRHELVTRAGEGLPPVYYGTVDATLLWVSLLHDAWRWGMPADQVAALLPNLEAALGWLAHHADSDGDGFVEYIDTSGHGLGNQGWKDSGDSVRFRDGSRARPPIALCEVQGYAYRAAMDGAAMLEAFGLPGAGRWREYAAALADRFREQYWVDGPQGRFPALALDRDKRPVDSLTSNIGHLLGTGLLSEAESAQVAGVLVSPVMSSGFGLRTMSTEDGGFSPLSYHCGSVWAHDTAIVIGGLARAGHGAEAALLAEGLLAAAEAFDYRLPELYGGDSRGEVPRPVPYPAACRPQAWSAAASVAILQAAVGLCPDVPGGQTVARPLAGSPLGAISVRGLRVAGQPYDVSTPIPRDIGTPLPRDLAVVPPDLA